MVDLHRCALHSNSLIYIFHPHYYNIYQSNRFQFLFLFAYMRKMNFWFFLAAPIHSIFSLLSFHFISCVFWCETKANLYAKLCNRIALSDSIKRKIEERVRKRMYYLIPIMRSSSKAIHAKWTAWIYGHSLTPTHIMASCLKILLFSRLLSAQ